MHPDDINEEHPFGAEPSGPWGSHAPAEPEDAPEIPMGAHASKSPGSASEPADELPEDAEAMESETWTRAGAIGILSALEAGLAGSIDGFSILDRELSFESVGRIDFVGTDEGGRLVLVLLLDDDADVASLAAFDMASLARRHAPLIARHLGLIEHSPDSSQHAPRCVLVAESFGPRLRARLALLAAVFELFELQVLQSERGQCTYLVPVTLADSGAPTTAQSVEEISPEAFLVNLDNDSQDAVEILFSRMQRMDSEFDTSFTTSGAHWSFGGRDFLQLERRGERVIGQVLPGGRPLALSDVTAVETLVEEAFSAYVRLLGLFDDAEQPYEMQPAVPEPLLTPEEIEAFQS